MLNETFSLRGSGCSTSDDCITLPRHRWYVIKEAFSPRILHAALEANRLEHGDLILDPFCGSGTTPLAATMAGHTALGIERNPFLAFVSKTKLAQCRPTTIQNHLGAVEAAAIRGAVSPLESFSTFSPAGGAEKWLFNTSVLRAFEGGWVASGECAGPGRDLLRMCLLGAAMDNCNAFTDGKCLRYRPDWGSIALGKSEFLASLAKRVEEVNEDLKSTKLDASQAEVIGGDSRTLVADIDGPFKLCVTSPPYLNSFDYSDVYRPELFLGRFVRSNAELRIIRRSTIRSHVQANWPAPKRSSFGQTYARTIAEIRERASDLWDKRIPMMVQAYFEDMEDLLLRLRRLAADESTIWIVVATSAYAGVEVPVDFILAEIGERCGWCLHEIGVIRHLRTSGQNTAKTDESSPGPPPRLRESIVILSTKRAG
jgi:DNA modification methylase